MRFEITPFDELGDERRSFLTGAAHREFGNVPLVREHVWAEPDWALFAVKDGPGFAHRATPGGEVASSLSLVVRVTRFDGKPTKIVGIHNLITEPRERKAGAASALLSRALEYAVDELAAEAVLLFCGDDLIRFYEPFGFAKVACPVWFDQPSGRKGWSSNCLVKCASVVPSKEIDLCGLPW